MSFFHYTQMQNVFIKFRFDVLQLFSHTSSPNCTSSSIRKMHRRSSKMYLMAEIKFLQQRWWLSTRWDSNERTSTDIPDKRSTIKIIPGESISRRCSTHLYIITNLDLFISARLNTRFGRYAMKIPKSHHYLDAVFANRPSFLSAPYKLITWPSRSLTYILEALPSGRPPKGRGLQMNIHEVSRALFVTW